MFSRHAKWITLFAILVATAFASMRFASENDFLYDEANYLGSAAHMRFQGLRDYDCWTPPLAKMYMSLFVPSEVEPFLLKPSDPARVEMQGASLKFWPEVPSEVRQSILSRARTGQTLLWLMTILGLCYYGSLITGESFSLAAVAPAFSIGLIALATCAYLEGLLFAVLTLHAIAAVKLNRDDRWRNRFLFSISVAALALTKNSIIPQAVVSLLLSPLLISGNFKKRLRFFGAAAAITYVSYYLLSITDTFVWNFQKLQRNSYIELLPHQDGVAHALYNLAKRNLIPSPSFPQLGMSTITVNLKYPVTLFAQTFPEQTKLLAAAYLAMKLSPLDALLLIAPFILLILAWRKKKLNSYVIFLCAEALIYFAQVEKSGIKIVYRYWSPLLFFGAFSLPLIYKIVDRRFFIWPLRVACLYSAIWGCIFMISHHSNFLSDFNVVGRLAGGAVANLPLLDDSGQEISHGLESLHGGFLVSAILTARAFESNRIDLSSCRAGKFVSVTTTSFDILNTPNQTRMFFPDGPQERDFISDTLLQRAVPCASVKPLVEVALFKKGAQEGLVDRPGTIAVACDGVTPPEMILQKSDSSLAYVAMDRYKLDDEPMRTFWFVDAPSGVSSWKLDAQSRQLCVGQSIAAEH